MNGTTIETREAALVRLADQARATGVRLRHDGDGRWWASSTSQPGTWHVVTGYSCDCPGFVNHAKCRHYAALLAAFGWLPGAEPSEDRDPDPDPPAPVALPVPARCGQCDGSGVIVYTRGTGPTTFVYDTMTCSCGGAKVAA